VELVQPLLAREERRFQSPGRERLSKRKALSGILFVLHAGIAWRHLPKKLGFGSGITMLAPDGGVARSWGMGDSPPATSCQTASLRRDRLVPDGYRR
jgi:transposase